MLENPNKEILCKYNLKSFEYDIIIARIEPENNIKMIIDAFVKSNVSRKLVVIGNMNTKLAEK